VVSFRFLAENPFGLLLSHRARRPDPFFIRDIVLGLPLPKSSPEATAPRSFLVSLPQPPAIFFCFFVQRPRIVRYRLLPKVRRGLPNGLGFLRDAVCEILHLAPWVSCFSPQQPPPESVLAFLRRPGSVFPQPALGFRVASFPIAFSRSALPWRLCFLPHRAAMARPIFSVCAPPSAVFIFPVPDFSPQERRRVPISVLLETS
jgi:hypothetical protein